MRKFTQNAAKKKSTPGSSSSDEIAMQSEWQPSRQIKSLVLTARHVYIARYIHCSRAVYVTRVYCVETTDIIIKQ